MMVERKTVHLKKANVNVACVLFVHPYISMCNLDSPLSRYKNIMPCRPWLVSPTKNTICGCRRNKMCSMYETSLT